MRIVRAGLASIMCVLTALSFNAPAKDKPKPAEPEKPVAAKEPEAEEPYKKLTKEQIGAITYEECEDDMGVTFPFFPDFERVGDNEDRKKSFDEWKEKIEKWEPKQEAKTVQK